MSLAAGIDKEFPLFYALMEMGIEGQEVITVVTQIEEIISSIPSPESWDSDSEIISSVSRRK